MNASHTSSPSCARGEPVRHAAPRHKADRERCEADFQRLLRDKDTTSDDDEVEVEARPESDPRAPQDACRQAGDGKTCREGALSKLAGGDDPGEQAPASTLLSQLPQPALPPALGGQQAAQACAALEAPPRTFIDPPVAAQFDSSLDGADGTTAGRSFEVSVNERLGLPLSMLVTPPGAVQAGQGWMLSIASSNLNPSILKRYSGRLDERLRSLSLTSEPVHIEHDDELGA
jgi:hypothetical protein